MRVMTWNVWWRFGDRWRARQDAILATLAAAEPDIVGLQEVWGTGPTANDAQKLADKLGMHAVFAGPSLPPPPGGEDGADVGIALLSRWPVVSADVHRMHSGHRTEEIVTIAAVVDHPAGPLSVLVSCLDWEPGSTGPRRAQIRDLIRLLHDPSRNGDLPVLLLADFNTSPDRPEMRELTDTAVDAWAVAGNGPGHTMSTTNPFASAGPWQLDRRIDFVIARPGRPDRPVRVERAMLAGDAVDGVYPSDHYAVVADLELPVAAHSR
jgi:endonuclease/exonuclease/phosphatase family metal-dependent hydrolase